MLTGERINLAKKFLLTFLSFLILISLSACLEETHIFEISSKGGTAVHEQVITKEVYDQIISMGADVDSLKDEGYTIDFFNKDSKEYVKAAKNFKFRDLKDVERYFQEMSTSEEGANSEKYFSNFEIENENGKLTLKETIGKPDAASAYTSCEIFLNFENKISKFTIGEKTSDKSLKLDMLKLWETKSGESFLIVSGENNFYFTIILISVILILMIGFFFFFLFKKKFMINKKG